MSNPVCTSDDINDAGYCGPVWPLNGNWVVRCGCGWEYEFEYSEENYTDAGERLEAHRATNPARSTR